MSATQPVPPQLEGSMFLFKKPELLNKEQHSKLGISRTEKPFGYAAGVRAIPLTLSELTSASRFFPVIFAQAENPLPLAVVGIIEDNNLFVDETGAWDQYSYIPGYLRRYPFALANDKGSDQNNPRMAMILDAEYEGIKENADFPFFEANGEPSEQMKNTMEYCETYERDRLVTVQFGEQLKKYDILTEQVAQFTPEGENEPKPFARYVGVDEAKLNALTDEQFLELRKSNILPILHAQLISMANWRLLMERRARRHNLTGAAVLEPLKIS